MEVFLVLIKNLNIVITGTSRGVGHELSKKFLSKGNKVWGCSRSKSNIYQKNYFHTKIDLCKEFKIEKWVKKIEKETNKKIDIFISNSSIFNRNLNSLESDLSIVETVKINLLAPILLTKYISRCMIKNKKGTIIFFSSIASILDEIGTSTYASSKAGLETFSKIIKKELKPFKIKLNILRILFISTKLSNSLNKNKITNLKKKFKTNRFGTVSKIFKEIEKIHFNKGNLSDTLLHDNYKNKA